ncbi:uncharacterized protein QC763_711130 [Podospora pseudopauciseta]|uniref:DUF7137 domain-containing protein n=2 Tax=Podospora TaxID=5144 RepID=A0ABR0H2C5_9PEZI|nr:hypothetical protein QC763_711130 [Podospora pseudopauciseta]KAK4668852.1 hypothetical protein QC764_711130 [Podospora pseudoanserina]
MKFSSAVALLGLSSSVSALAWPGFLPELDSLVVRQNSDETTNSPKPTNTPSSNDNNNEEEEEKTTTGPATPLRTNLNTAGISQSGKATGSAAPNGTTSGKPRQTEFNPQDPAGAVVMITPSVMEGYQLYKIGDYITWAWNYTNLQGTPTAIDVLVTNTVAKQTWTLTQNMTFQEQGSYTWDTGAYDRTAVASPLLVEQYTLIIHDSDSEPTGPAPAGMLAPFNSFKFGLYTPKVYTPISDGWKCASCNGAGGMSIDSKAVAAAGVMSVITVLSFTWFVAGFGGLM